MMNKTPERIFSYRGMFQQIGAMESELEVLQEERKTKKSIDNKELSEDIEILKEKIKSLEELTLQAIKDKTGA